MTDGRAVLDDGDARVRRAEVDADHLVTSHRPSFSPQFRRDRQQLRVRNHARGQRSQDSARAARLTRRRASRYAVSADADISARSPASIPMPCRARSRICAQLASPAMSTRAASSRGVSPRPARQPASRKPTSASCQEFDTRWSTVSSQYGARRWRSTIAPAQRAQAEQHEARAEQRRDRGGKPREHAGKRRGRRARFGGLGAGRGRRARRRIGRGRERCGCGCRRGRRWRRRGGDRRRRGVGDRRRGRRRRRSGRGRNRRGDRRWNGGRRDRRRGRRRIRRGRRDRIGAFGRRQILAGRWERRGLTAARHAGGAGAADLAVVRVAGRRPWVVDDAAADHATGRIADRRRLVAGRGSPACRARGERRRRIVELLVRASDVEVLLDARALDRRAAMHRAARQPGARVGRGDVDARAGERFEPPQLAARATRSRRTRAPPVASANVARATGRLGGSSSTSATPAVRAALPRSCATARRGGVSRTRRNSDEHQARARRAARCRCRRACPVVAVRSRIDSIQITAGNQNAASALRSPRLQ